MKDEALRAVSARVSACEDCPRLRAHCVEVARVKRRAYRDWDYWGRPVPGFGDPEAKLLIIGLAPAAHGANRTGRMFTGDRSGDLLYATLHRLGLASQAESVSRDDGMELRGVYIAAMARCAPPGNKPARDELANCRQYLEEELRILQPIPAVLCLGRIAWDGYLGILRDQGIIDRPALYPFAHGAEFRVPAGGPALIGCYHPSQQNTQTGRLTPEMFFAAISLAASRAGLGSC